MTQAISFATNCYRYARIGYYWHVVVQMSTNCILHFALRFTFRYVEKCKLMIRYQIINHFFTNVVIAYCMPENRRFKTSWNDWISPTVSTGHIIPVSDLRRNEVQRIIIILMITIILVLLLSPQTDNRIKPTISIYFFPLLLEKTMESCVHFVFHLPPGSMNKNNYYSGWRLKLHSLFAMLVFFVHLSRLQYNLHLWWHCYSMSITFIIMCVNQSSGRRQNKI